MELVQTLVSAHARAVDVVSGLTAAESRSQIGCGGLQVRIFGVTHSQGTDRGEDHGTSGMSAA